MSGLTSLEAVPLTQTMPLIRADLPWNCRGGQRARKAPWRAFIR
jgi:hypothetical protein